MSLGFNVAIDIGGSGLKVGFRPDGTNEPWRTSFETGTSRRSTSDASKKLLKHCFENPDCAAERLVECLINLGADRIHTLAISVSGTVDHDKDALICSDRLNEISRRFGGYKSPFDLLAQIRPRLARGDKLSLCNDSVACALAATSVDGILLPVLTITLGTYPAIAIADKPIPTGSWRIIPAEEWTSNRIGTADGLKPISDAICAETLEGLGTGQSAVVRKGQRIGRAVAKLLPVYQSKFANLPRTVVVRGGCAIELNEKDIHTGLLQEGATMAACGKKNAEVAVRLDGRDYLSYTRLQLDGADSYRQLRHKKEIIIESL